MESINIYHTKYDFIINNSGFFLYMQIKSYHFIEEEIRLFRNGLNTTPQKR